LAVERRSTAHQSASPGTASCATRCSVSPVVQRRGERHAGLGEEALAQLASLASVTSSITLTAMQLARPAQRRRLDQAPALLAVSRLTIRVSSGSAGCPLTIL
jgi:hypothetical protein